MPVKEDRSVGWTRRSAAASLLHAMEGHRKEQGIRLVRLREVKGWSQEDLAHAAKLSVKTISRFENGRHDGRRTTIDKLADALDVDKRVIEGPPPAPLGLGAETDGLTEVLSLLRGLDSRLARLEDLLTERELEDLEAEAEAQSPPKVEPADRRAADDA